MAMSNDYPSNLPTNTYILHDFVDIAYIVCTSTNSASADRGGNAQDAQSRERILTRLKNTEQQFRQASILVALDAEKLELFTFYKTVDIVKDQKTILSKFSQVLKLNSCIIAYKNACRVVEILKPDASRIYKLFTTAVLSSVRLQTPQGGRIVRVGINIYIVRSAIIDLQDQRNADIPRSHYTLQKVNLQVTAGGQLLLLLQKADWPPLVLVSDITALHGHRLLERADITCYLAPTGQLAAYRSGWIGSLDAAQRELETSKERPLRDLRARLRSIEKTRIWITSRISSFTISDERSIWIEVEVPALIKPENQDEKERVLIWKSIYWPVELCYIFDEKHNLSLEHPEDMTTRDPLKAAEDWLLVGAVQAQEGWSESLGIPPTSRETEDRLFDDDVHFDSPQQFASFPLQGIPNSQTVYPTPPDVMTAQATPGFAMIDGTAQTPATIHHVQSSLHQSSPLANVSEAQQNLPADATMSNFLSHSEEEDLFEEMDDHKLIPASFADEPNWDFFDRGSPEEILKTEAVQRSKDEAIVETGIAQAESSDIDMQKQVVEPQTDVDSLETNIGDNNLSNLPAADSPKDAVIVPDNVETGIAVPLNDTTPSEDFEKMEGLLQTTTQLGKRRRSSAYNVEVNEKDNRDLKYSTNGKYWFALRTQSTTDKANNALPSARRSSSDSSSSYSSSQGQSVSDEDEALPKAQKPWAKYSEISTPRDGGPGAEEQFDVIECDADIDHLLQLISMSTGEGPFTTPMPDHRPIQMSPHEDPDRYSLVIQLLNENIAQSALFRGIETISLPETVQMPTMELSFDNAGSNSLLNNALLGDLVTLQSTTMQVKPSSKIMQLDHGRIRLQQMDSVITADLSILKYWELLNLQPLYGEKSGSAVCIHPDNEYYAEGCRSFLRRVGETYGNCNLGFHNNMDLPPFVEDGLASWPSWPDRDQLLSLCQDMGKALAEYDQSDSTYIIIYMVLPDDDLSHCYMLCDAFVELYESFMENRTLPEPGQVFLQLIPSSMLVNEDTPAIPTEEQYVSLALEVYSRGRVAEGTGLSAKFRSAFTLDKPAHPFIQFELDSKIASPLQRYGNCCHLAYSVSADKRWLAATWSDSTGMLTLSKAYCLPCQEEGKTHSRLEILKHMSKTSTQLMNRQKSKWWLAIAKTGMYEVEELQEWLYICGQLSDEHSLLSRAVLLSTELQPRICPHGAGGIPRPMTNHLANAGNTPVTTPQATTSPDQAVPFTPSTSANIATMAQTPPESNSEAAGDHEIYLVDPLEDGWMATFPFGVNQASSCLDIRPALASGLLLKRIHADHKGGNDLAALGVNLVAVTRKPATPLMPQEREQILQEILAQYRGLHTFAVAKGYVDPSKSCVPWHVASSYKGANLLQHILS